MKEKLERWKITLFGLMLFLVPLISFPFTFNHFELPKLIIFYLFSIVLLILFCIKAVNTDKLVLEINRIVIVLAIFTVFYLISTLHSIDLSTSIIGNYPRIQDGALFLISSLVVFFTTFTITRKANTVLIKEILYYPALAGVICLVYGAVQYLTIFSQGVTGEIRVSGLEDHPIYFGTIVMISFFIFWALRTLSQKREKLLWEIALVASFITIILSLTRSVWISLTISIVITLAFLYKKAILNPFYPSLKPLLLTSFVIAVVFGLSLETISQRISKTFSFNQQENNLFIRLGEIKGAMNIIYDYPWFGTGPSTLILIYPKYKPVELNYTKEWEQTTDYIRNNYLHYVATTGLFTALTYILFIILITFYTLKCYKEKASLILLGGFLSLSIQQLFYHQTVTSNLFFWTFAGLLTGFSISEEKVVTIHSKAIKFLGWGVLIICFGCSLILGRLFMADINFVQGLKTFNLLSNDPTRKNVFLFFRGNFSSQDLNLSQQSWQRVSKAIELNPWNDIYKREGVYILLTQAKIYKDFQQLNQAQKSYEQALEWATNATNMHPNNSLNHYFLALVYIQMAKNESHYGDRAIESMKRSVALNPNNPLEYNNLGVMYLELKRYQEAEQPLRQAISLKTDLAESYFHLGEILKQEGKKEEAVNAYEEVFKFEPDNQFARSEINKISP